MTTLNKDAHAATAFSQLDDSPSGALYDSVFFGPSFNTSDNARWSKRIDELLEIRDLLDDWDGEGTAAPPASLVDGAIRHCMTLRSSGFPPPDRVHASVNETIFLEWYGALDYLEVEVLSPVEAEYRLVDRGTGRTEVSRLRG